MDLTFFVAVILQNGAKHGKILLRHKYIRVISRSCFCYSGKNTPPVFVSSESLKTCVAAIGVMCFSGIRFGGCPFCMKEAAAMDLNYFKDVLFDLMNESDALDVEDIQSDDKENRFVVTVRGGAVFSVQVSSVK